MDQVGSVLVLNPHLDPTLLCVIFLHLLLMGDVIGVSCHSPRG